MNYPKYRTEVSNDHTIYTFISKGTNGNIEKVIKYSLTNRGSV